MDSNLTVGVSRHTDILTQDAASDLALPWIVRLRYGMVFGAATILLGTGYAFWPDRRLLWTLAPLAVVLGSNILLDRIREVSMRLPQKVLGTVFIVDTLCLTVVLGLTGGPMNPFSLLYLVQITLSVVVLQKAWTWILGILADVCFGLLFFFHIPFAPFHVFHAERGFSPHLVGMWVAFVVAATLITLFTGSVSDALRRREQEVLTLQQHIAKHERLASLATLAAGAAHELGTPLGTIAVVSRDLEHYASNLPNGNELRDDAKLIRSEVDRCQLILQRMGADGAEPMGESARMIHVKELLGEMLQRVPEGRRSSVSVDTHDGALILFLPVRATVQSLLALVQNALDASTSDMQVVLKARCNGHEMIFSVCDNGRGMPEAVLGRISEPFFTTKDPGMGMGLGTFLVRTFAERLGGELSYESALGRGTTATLTLPMQSSQQGRNTHVTA